MKLARHADGHIGMSVWSILLRLIGPLVPSNQRADWCEGWQAELGQEGSSRVAVSLTLVFGAVRHALILRLYDIETIPQDVHYAIRGLAKRPGFTTAAVLTLSLGIGANTAVFSIVDRVFLRPLPYANSDRLYWLFEEDSLGTAQRLTSYPTVQDWREQSDVFDGLAYVHGTTGTLIVDGRPEFLIGAFVTQGFFATLGTTPLLGRTFLPEDRNGGGQHVILLSHGLWTRSFGGREDVVGTTIPFGDATFTVVGVMPRAFDYPNWGARSDFWAPFEALPPADAAAANQRSLSADSRVIARLRSSTTVAAANQQLDVIERRLAAQYPDESGGWTHVVFRSLNEVVVGDVGPRLTVLFGAVAAVLLIGCANLANLLLVQGTTRSREFGIRTALGAGRGRVVRQLLTENLLLGAAGCGVGVLLAVWGVNSLKSAAPNLLPRLDEVVVDGPVLAFAVALSVATVVVFGLLPAVRVTRVDLVSALKDGPATLSTATRQGRLRGTLIVTELALAMVTLIGAGLLIKSFWRLSQVDPGFDPKNLVSYYIVPPPHKYDDAARLADLYTRLLNAAAAVPGVASAALVNHLPGGRGSGIFSRAIVGSDAAASGSETQVLFRTVTPGYFGTMAIPVLQGREFTETDVASYAGGIVINQTLARAWGDESPLGRRVTVFKAAKELPDFGEPIHGRVIGVVADAVHFNLYDTTAPVAYVPYNANPWFGMNLVARTMSDPGSVTPMLDKAILGVDPTIPIAGRRMGSRTMEQRRADSVADRRLYTMIVAIFASSALLLTTVGLYGVVSYVVTLRTNEIGIRMALGANRIDVARGIFVQAAGTIGLGLAVGIGGALGATRVITSLLFQVKATDPATFAIVTIFLASVAVAACYLPARRAARVDPMIALRAE